MGILGGQAVADRLITTGSPASAAEMPCPRPDSRAGTIGLRRGDRIPEACNTARLFSYATHIAWYRFTLCHKSCSTDPTLAGRVTQEDWKYASRGTSTFLSVHIQLQTNIKVCFSPMRRCSQISEPHSAKKLKTDFEST